MMTNLLSKVKELEYMIHKNKLFSIALVLIVLVFMLVSIAGAAPFAYIPEGVSTENVTVIDTATNTVTANVPVGNGPFGVAVTPDGGKVYVTNSGHSNNVSIINTATNTVTTNVSVGISPEGVAVTPDGKNVYVTNHDSNTVSVINTINNTAYATVLVEIFPEGVAVTPDGKNVYVVNSISNTVSVINIATNTVTATVPVGDYPHGVAVTPDGTKAYVANNGDNTVSVINTATSTVVATVPVGNGPFGVAVTPDGGKVYVTNADDRPGDVSVINTTTNTVTATVNGFDGPIGVAITPDGSTVYVANGHSNTVSVINTTTNAVTATVNVGGSPWAFGQFIGPEPVAPTITWDNPADIVYGTPLNSTQLNADALDPISGALVPGTFIYTPPSGTVLNVGMEQTLSTTFTPNDTVNYTTTSANVSINVTPSTPTIFWSNPADIAYGTPLSNIQLNANASVPGTFVYIPPSGTILSAGSNQTLTATFTPNDTVNYTIASATVSINVKVAPTITWSNPADIVYGTPLSNVQLDANASVPGTFVYTPQSGTVLSADLNQILTTTFTPTDIANYTTASANVSINVTQSVPTIIWSNPANVTYGTALSDTQLDATISPAGGGNHHRGGRGHGGGGIRGTFVYAPPSGTVLDLGTYTLNTIFTPTDITDYTTASANVSINVTPATPTVFWSNPADITYGTALNSTQLNANASVPGTFRYDPVAGTVLNAGSHQALNTTFTPNDTVNYTAASATVLINVLNTTQSNPTIFWSSPADITYGTPLSSVQLDATASVPGTFVYSPTSGTILNMGSGQRLNTTFTPTDIANYTTASANVSINVTQGVPIINWNPPNVYYGTPLSNDQLDASASDPVSGATVSGNFVYSPPSGTVLSGGTWILNTTFTPNDTANYTTTSANASINVLNPLVLTKQVPLSAYNGTSMTYWLYYTNYTQIPVSNVILTDTLPNNVTFVSASNNGNYDSSTGTITWDIGSL